MTSPIDVRRNVLCEYSDSGQGYLVPRASISKALLDRSFSAVVLVLTTPLFVLIAVLIKLSSPGPVFYRKTVFGLGGRTVQMLKFRTMQHDADRALLDVLAVDVALMREWQEKQKLRTDPRITRVGRFLRRFSLDEIPQFWNVLRGDLSVVGPRPYFADASLYVAAQYEALRRAAPIILSVRPGITCLWATGGRARLSFDERIRLDKEYVEIRSLWQDLKLVAKTVPTVFISRGAY